MFGVGLWACWIHFGTPTATIEMFAKPCVPIIALSMCHMQALSIIPPPLATLSDEDRKASPYHKQFILNERAAH